MKKEMPCSVTDDSRWDYDYYLESCKKLPETDDMEESKNAREENENQ